MSQDYSEITPGLPVPEYVPRPKPTIIPIAAWNDAPLFCLQLNDEWVSHLLGVLTALDQPDTWIGTEDEIFAARQQVNEIMVALMNACPPSTYSIWSDSDVPAVENSGDSDPVELGIAFRTSVAGNVLGLRFYKGSDNTGTHTGYLYNHARDMLGDLTFTDESATGWQTAYFDTPIPIMACEEYVAAYFSPTGSFSYSRPYFTDEVASPPIYAPSTTQSPNGNGRYRYGWPVDYPEGSFEGSNYWMDIIFEPTGADYLE